MPPNIDARNQKELIQGSSGEAAPACSTGPVHHPGSNSLNEGIHGQPTAISHQNNMLFPTGKFFGLFPRIANVDDQVHLNIIQSQQCHNRYCHI